MSYCNFNSSSDVFLKDMKHEGQFIFNTPETVSITVMSNIAVPIFTWLITPR